MANALVLCSGGLDSVVTLYYVKKKLTYDNMVILFFDYGQRNIKKEREFSKKCSIDNKSKFVEIKLDFLSRISTSLLNLEKTVKKIKRSDLKDTKQESLKWYVPSRNLIFLSYAISIAETFYIKEKKKFDIFVGFKNEGKESYPDTSKQFLDNLNKISRLSTLSKNKIYAPLIDKDKEDIIILGKKLGVDFNKTFSCYNSFSKHCGYCLSCRLRQEGFYWANIRDPTKYKSKMKDYRTGHK